MRKVWPLLIRAQKREGVMLTRREFAGIASCAICGITAFASQASAQGAPPAATAGVTRKILSQMDGPAPGYVKLLVEATIEAAVAAGRHTPSRIQYATVVGSRLRLAVRSYP